MTGRVARTFWEWFWPKIPTKYDGKTKNSEIVAASSSGARGGGLFRRLFGFLCWVNFIFVLLRIPAPAYFNPCFRILRKTQKSKRKAKETYGKKTVLFWLDLSKKKTK